MGRALKKNLISIFLFAGAVALNLSMLGQASCAGSRAPMQVNEAAAVAAQHSFAFGAAHPDGRGSKAGSESLARGSAVKCGCALDDSVTHFDLNFDMKKVEPAPQGRVPQALSAAVSFFTNLPPVPQDRPPAPA